MGHGNTGLIIFVKGLRLSFTTFAFHPQITAGIQKMGYTTPTPIQSRTIPPILEGHDVLGLAQTGTGKTAAFALPILQGLMKGPRGRLRALILSPTRELAEQTHQTIGSLGYKTGLRSLTIYGGVSAKPQMQALQSGVEIAVACPGRLLDLMRQGAVNLKQVEILVLDEADQMFDMGFLPAIRQIVRSLPRTRQTLLFSATMPKEIRALADDFLHKPVTVELGVENPIKTVSHAIYPVEQAQKIELLKRHKKGLMQQLFPVLDDDCMDAGGRATQDAQAEAPALRQIPPGHPPADWLSRDTLHWAPLSESPPYGPHARSTGSRMDLRSCPFTGCGGRLSAGWAWGGVEKAPPPGFCGAPVVRVPRRGGRSWGWSPGGP
mgnify:CR=1 FL=1